MAFTSLAVEGLWYPDPAHAKSRTFAEPLVVGRDHLALARGSTWFVADGGAQGAVASVAVPGRGVPLAGDWNGDGVATPARFEGGRWWLAHGLGGSAGTTLHYGRPGDLPVVGDWNGDGVDGLGVVRQGVWFLVQKARGGAADLRFGYGKPDDLPVVGDWDADGHDEPGIVRGAVWHLHDRTSSGIAWRSLRFGRSDDVPVAGDWNGDGQGDLGVRRRNVMYTRLDLSSGPAHSTFVLGRASDTPFAWSSPARGSRRCPGAAWDVGASPASGIRLPDPARFRQGGLSAAEEGLRSAVADAGRYQWNQRSARYTSPREGWLLDLRSTHHVDELALRLPGLEAFALAVAGRTGVLPPDVAEDREVRAHVARLVASLACQHRATAVGGWGPAWQSSMWAYLAGTAGWLVWDELTAAERAAVARMVVFEADRHTTPPSRFHAAKDGRILSEGNTKFEEVGWDTNVVQLASAMLPGHARAIEWTQAEVALSLMAAARPADTTSDEVVNGVELGEWLLGWNIYDDGFLVNHGQLHPDYMSEATQLWSGGVLHALAGQSVPAAAFHNGTLIYEALAERYFEAPPYLSPGGSVYVPASGDIYYPEGSDWGTVGRARWVALDAMASAFGLQGSSAADEWFDLHVQAQRDLQSRFTTGQTHGAASEFPYLGAEEFTAQKLALGWLTRVVLGNGDVAVDQSDVGLELRYRAFDTEVPPSERPRSP